MAKKISEEVVKHRSGDYMIVTVESNTTPGKFYRVDTTNGRCSCPAWKFSKGHTRICSHLKELGYTGPLIPEWVTAPDAPAKTPAPKIVITDYEWEL